MFSTGKFSTRLVASCIVLLPFFILGLVSTYVSTDFSIVHAFGQSQCTYQHYFRTFVSSHDVWLSSINVVVLTTIVTIIHCYYGFVAQGGPEGVGQATGRAIRASIIALVVTDIVLSLALWGPTQQAQISG